MKILKGRIIAIMDMATATIQAVRGVADNPERTTVLYVRIGSCGSRKLLIL
jgi:hypothetical protein